MMKVHVHLNVANCICKIVVAVCLMYGVHVDV